MERINVAELLKDCPKGMELYSPLCGDCKLYDVNDYNIRIETPNKDTLISLYHDGRYCVNGEIMIFPKGKTTWEGFHRPLKDGDIVTYYYENGLVSMILNKFVNFVEIHHHCALYDNAKEFVTNNYIVGEPKYTRLADEEEKEKLFKAIKERGYKWNAETKTLEKLIEPKFKAGDRIIRKNNICVPILITNVSDEFYYSNTESSVGVLSISEQDEYVLVPNKFDINTLIPFESRVLVRDNKLQKWSPAIWGFYDSDSKDYQYKLIGVIARYCIPYEGNEHLLGSTNDCDEYFKTWK